MKEEASSATNLPRAIILPDAPTAIDEFGAHSRVALAIAELVRQGSSAGRSIALTGSWGSGKSSVIEMLRQKFAADRRGDYDPEIFLFDAWVHQGDPLRRAFLECMIQRAVELDPLVATEELAPEPGQPRKTRKTRWTEELDLITGRRETSEARADRPLTGWGLAVAVSLLLCLPLGASFLSKYDPLKSFWHSTFARLFVAAYLTPILIALVAWVKSRFEPEALKALLLREARQDTTTTTVKTKEPSSVDFKRVFSRIAGHVLIPESRQLIVVIDNLDRIDAASAVSVWTTMRIFFELDGDDVAWKTRLWLIVPFDRSALSGLWKSGACQRL